MAAAALALFVFMMLLAGALRTLIQRRRTGDSGNRRTLSPRGSLGWSALTATDLMGNIGESPEVEIIVSSSGFSTKRLEKMQEKRILQTALDKLSDTAEQLDKAGEKFKQSFESLRSELLVGPDSSPFFSKQTQFNQDRVAAQAAAQELELRAGMAWAMVKEAARGSDPFLRVCPADAGPRARRGIGGGAPAHSARARAPGGASPGVRPRAVGHGCADPHAHGMRRTSYKAVKNTRILS